MLVLAGLCAVCANTLTLYLERSCALRVEPAAHTFPSCCPLGQPCSDCTMCVTRLGMPWEGWFRACRSWGGPEPLPRLGFLTGCRCSGSRDHTWRSQAWLLVLDSNVQGVENRLLCSSSCSSNMHFMSVRRLHLLPCPPDRSLLALHGAGSL